MNRLEVVYSVRREGGVGSIEGGQGEVLSLPGRAANGDLLPNLPVEDPVALPGDLLVMSFCAARLNFGTTAVDEFGNPLPSEGRDWTGFMLYPGETEIPFASAVAVMLDEDFTAIPIEYGGGFLGNLDEGYGLTLYRGVKRIVGSDLMVTAPEPVEVSFEATYLPHQDIRTAAMLGAVGQRVHGFVTGFPTSDDTEAWTNDVLVGPGFNSTRLVHYVSDTPRGFRWTEYSPPGDDALPGGHFLAQGTAPDLLVGVLYLELFPEAEVTRQFPRDDSFGVIGGGRVFPPPRRGRVFGGQQ